MGDIGHQFAAQIVLLFQVIQLADDAPSHLVKGVAQAVDLVAAFAANPHFSPPFYCTGPMARPAWRSLGRSARQTVKYA